MEETALDPLFWARVREILNFTKPIYHMIRFSNTDKPVIGEVYQQMDSMLGQIKDVVKENDPNLYATFHDCVHSGINLMFHYMPWHISLCQNTTLHLGWANLHLEVGLGSNLTQI